MIDTLTIPPKGNLVGHQKDHRNWKDLQLGFLKDHHLLFRHCGVRLTMLHIPVVTTDIQGSHLLEGVKDHHCRAVAHLPKIIEVQGTTDNTPVQTMFSYSTAAQNDSHESRYSKYVDTNDSRYADLNDAKGYSVPTSLSLEVFSEQEVNSPGMKPSLVQSDQVILHWRTKVKWAQGLKVFWRETHTGRHYKNRQQFRKVKYRWLIILRYQQKISLKKQSTVSGKFLLILISQDRNRFLIGVITEGLIHRPLSMGTAMNFPLVQGIWGKVHQRRIWKIWIVYLELLSHQPHLDPVAWSTTPKIVKDMLQSFSLPNKFLQNTWW